MNCQKSLQFSACLIGLLIVLGCSQVPSFPDLENEDFERLANGATASDLAPSQPAAQLDAEFQAAREQEERGEEANAIRAYKRLAKESPDAPGSYHRLAILHDKAGQPEQSQRYYKSAIRLAPEEIGILCDYGYSRYLHGELEEAEKILRRVIDRNGAMKRAHNNLALVLARKGDESGALAAFRDGGATAEEARANLSSARAARSLDKRNESPIQR